MSVDKISLLGNSYVEIIDESDLYLIKVPFSVKAIDVHSPWLLIFAVDTFFPSVSIVKPLKQYEI